MSISSTPYATPLTIDLRHPLYAKAIVLVVHGLAALALLTAALPVALDAAGLAIIAASVYLVRFRLRYLRRVIWRADGSWLLIAHDGNAVVAQLAPDSLALPFITLLNFRSVPRGRQLSVVAFPTADNVETLRKLRVRLRVSAATVRE